MNIIITSRKFKARDILKDFITEEVKSLEKYNDRILSADVILSYQNSRDSIKIAEIIVQVPGQTLTATEEADEYKKAVSLAIEKLSRQLTKLKSKKTARIRA
jgi:putative sigma-54 modulation protein